MAIALQSKITQIAVACVSATFLLCNAITAAKMCTKYRYIFQRSGCNRDILQRANLQLFCLAYGNIVLYKYETEALNVIDSYSRFLAFSAHDNSPVRPPEGPCFLMAFDFRNYKISSLEIVYKKNIPWWFGHILPISRFYAS